jgi:hypothetical protein
LISNLPNDAPFSAVLEIIRNCNIKICNEMTLPRSPETEINATARWFYRKKRADSFKPIWTVEDRNRAIIAKQEQKASNLD